MNRPFIHSFNRQSSSHCGKLSAEFDTADGRSRKCPIHRKSGKPHQWANTAGAEHLSASLTRQTGSSAANTWQAVCPRRQLRLLWRAHLPLLLGVTLDNLGWPPAPQVLGGVHLYPAAQRFSNFLVSELLDALCRLHLQTLTMFENRN